MAAKHTEIRLNLMTNSGQQRANGDFFIYFLNIFFNIQQNIFAVPVEQLLLLLLLLFILSNWEQSFEHINGKKRRKNDTVGTAISFLF